MDKNLHFFVGTKAQLIKLFPIMMRLHESGTSFRTIDSGQHAEFTNHLRDSLGLPDPDVFLRRENKDIVSYFAAMKWLGGTIGRWAFSPGWIRKHVFGSQGGICVVHGDTASTLIGTLFAKRAGLQVAHVESGLRSFNWRDPFPEELIRIHCMKKSDLLFAPDDTSVGNLQKMKVDGEIIRSQGNTVADAVREAIKQESAPLKSDYLLATFHRLETLRSRDRVKKIVEILNLASEKFPVKFVIHKPTRKALERFQLLSELSSNVEKLPMQSYFEFINLIRNAKCMFADGGSIQEECALLGVPLLILRNRTEREDGLNRNARLCSFDLMACKTFLEQIDANRMEPSMPSHSPSAIIADVLVDRLGA